MVNLQPVKINRELFHVSGVTDYDSMRAAAADIASETLEPVTLHNHRYLLPCGTKCITFNESTEK